MKSRVHPLAILCAFATGVCAVRAAGVAVIKKHYFHRDSSARAVVYSRIIDSRGPYLRIISGGANVDILRSNLIARIEMPDEIPSSIMEEEDIAPLRETLADVRNFTARYPRSRPVLKQQTGALASYISRFDAGDVRYEGEWVSRKEFAAIQESRRREAEASNLTEVEKRVFEAAQRDQGLVLHNGKWMTKREAGEKAAESPTELSDAIEPLWNGDLDAARFAVKNLADLASRQTGAPKVRTERLMTAVRNLFLAESRLTQRIIARAGEFTEAAVHDKNAEKWLIPNGFGTIHKDASRDSRRKATEIRQRSADDLALHKRELMEQLREIEVVASDFEKLRENRVVLILNAASRAVAERHFPDGEFKPVAPNRSPASGHPRP
jgi:hypothetical protein